MEHPVLHFGQDIKLERYDFFIKNRPGKVLAIWPANKFNMMEVSVHNTRKSDLNHR